MNLINSRKKSFLLMFNISVIGIVIAVAISISLLFFFTIYKTNEEVAAQELDSHLNQIDIVLTQEIESIYNVTGNLAEDFQLGEAVENYYSGNLQKKVDGKRMIDYILYKAMDLNFCVESITLVSGEQIVQTGRYSLDNNKLTENIFQETWYTQLLNDEIQWAFGADPGFFEYSEGEGYYYCATKFRNKYYQNRAEESRIVVVTSQLNRNSWIEQLSELYHINFLLYTPEVGRILYKRGVDKEFNELTESWGTKVGTFSQLDSNFVMLQRTNLPSGWELRGFVKHATYDAMVYKIQNGLILLLLLVLIVDILISITLTQNCIKPLKKVMKGMEDIGEQNFYLLNEKGQYWEINQLVSTFNYMSNQIQELLSSIAEKEKEKQKMEFRVLENQINPHFIYNTLDATRWVAQINNDKTTASMISSLSRVLRIALSEGREVIPVEQEIIFTQEYLKIMIFRSNYNVSLNYAIDENAGRLLTLKMVLQPLVENCLIHAFTNKPPDATIDIRCTVHENKLIMIIEDNGSGIQFSKDKNHRTRHNNSLLAGIGLHNIERRIQLRYGSQYGITIQAIPERGTRVIVSQPILQEERNIIHDTSHVSGR